MSSEPDVGATASAPDVAPPASVHDVAPPASAPDVAPPAAAPDVAPPASAPDVAPPASAPDVAPPASARRQLSGWGRTAPTVATHHLAAPDEIATLVKSAGPRGLIARGLGRSYGDAAQNAGGEVVEFAHGADHLVLDRASNSASVAAGVSLDALMRALLPHGYFVPVSPGTRQVTVGGAIAADIHGKNHHVDGSFGRHVRWLELIDGTGAARRLDPVSTPDEFWATTGGMGLTGVITHAGIDLRPVESAWMRVETQRVRGLDELLDVMGDRSDDGHTYSVAWIDLLATGRSMGRSVLTRGEHANVSDLPERHRADRLAFAPRRLLSAPALPSGIAVNPLTMRAFNEAWYRRAPRRRRTLEPVAGFFHPLDAVDGWNRLYGRRGLLQYQFVVPTGAERVLAEAVAVVAETRQASFLAVLKRFGPGSAAPLSFPIAGWTLALDLPASPSLGGLLDRLDALVADAGGRIYLAKDSRARPDTIARMYPRLEAFRAIRRRLDPDGVFQSDLSRRLAL
jgi:decaprenylphospho-beta-D-ribofuranose 2-oxidase